MPVKSTSNASQVLTDLDRLIAKKVEETADETLRLVQEMYRRPKRGRLYGINQKKLKALRRFRAGKRKTAPSGVHRASAPGEAPAIDSAALRKGTTRTDVRRKSDRRWIVSLGVTLQSGRADVAKHLEFGTKRIAPRPAWRPALEIMRARRANLKG